MFDTWSLIESWPWLTSTTGPAIWLIKSRRAMIRAWTDRKLRNKFRRSRAAQAQFRCTDVPPMRVKQSASQAPSPADPGTFPEGMLSWFSLFAGAIHQQARQAMFVSKMRDWACLGLHYDVVLFTCLFFTRSAWSRLNANSFCSEYALSQPSFPMIDLK